MAIIVKRKYIVEAYGQPDKEFESADEAVRYAENNNGKSVTEFYSEYDGDRLTNTEPPVEIWCEGDDYCECDGCKDENAFAVDFPDSDIASIDSSDDADYDAMAYAYVEDSVNDWADDKEFIQEAVADLEENEDEVECKDCFELFPKGECVKTDHGYVCKECLKAESLEGTVDKDLGDDRTPEKTVQDKPTELTDGTAMRKHEKAIDEELKVIVDFSDYKPWQGAKETYDLIEDAGKLDELEEYLEECYPDGITATQINDLLWFDGESVLKYLGLGDEEDEEVDESLTEARKSICVPDKLDIVSVEEHEDSSDEHTPKRHIKRVQFFDPLEPTIMPKVNLEFDLERDLDSDDSDARKANDHYGKWFKFRDHAYDYDGNLLPSINPDANLTPGELKMRKAIHKLGVRDGLWEPDEDEVDESLNETSAGKPIPTGKKRSDKELAADLEYIIPELEKRGADKKLLDDLKAKLAKLKSKKEGLEEAKKDEDELPPDPAAVKLEVHQELNSLVNDEIEAINGYEEAKADIVDKPIEHKDEIINTINHIEDEEKEHIDELIDATSEIPFDGGRSGRPTFIKDANEASVTGLEEDYDSLIDAKNKLEDYLMHSLGLDVEDDSELGRSVINITVYDGKNKIPTDIDELVLKWLNKNNIKLNWNIGLFDGDSVEITISEAINESLSEHINEERPAIESDQKLKGADCAVVDCQTDQKLIAHSEDEKPLDCKMKKKPLDKPLTEGIIDGKISRYIKKRLADKKLSLSFKDNNKGGLGWQPIKTKNGTLVQDIPAAKVDALIKAAQAYSKKPGIEIALTFKDGEDNKTIAIYKAGKVIENKLNGIKTDRAAEDAVNALDDNQSNGETIDITSDDKKPATETKPEEKPVDEKPTPTKETPAMSEEKPTGLKTSDVRAKLQSVKTKNGDKTLPDRTINLIVNALKAAGIITEGLEKNSMDDPFDQEDGEERFTPEEQAENDCDEFGLANNGYIQFHHCGWCGDVFEEGDMRKEIDFGWLCDTCEAAIKSRGESLTFVEDLNEASTAEKRAYKNGGEDLDDLLIGKTVAAIDTPSVKKAVGNALRNGDPKNVAELKKLLRNDPRAGAAVDSYIKKAGAMQRAGVVAESADESLKEETSKNIRYAIGYCYWDYGWYEELAEKNSDGTQCGTTHADNYFYNNRVYDGKTFDSVDACIAEVKANVAKYAPLTYPENIDYAGGRKNGSLYAIGLNEAQNGFVSRKIIFDCKAHKLVPHKD